MMGEPTKGPWHFGPRFPDKPGHHEYVVQHFGPRDNFQEVVVINVGDEFQAPNQMADGYLIAAAPELREAVERLLYAVTPEAMGDTAAWNGAIDAGKAALAKARGEGEQ